MDLRVVLAKKYPGFTCDFSFSLHHPRCGVFGPSGSGKSTLMHMLAGLVAPDEGRIELNGRTLYDSMQNINLQPEQRRVGVVFQQGHLFPHLNVEENLLYGMKRTARSRQTIDLGQLTEVLQLGALYKRSVNKLSGGEKQRVALGRTILACPDLILLDEPLTGLDDRLKYQIISYLQRVFVEFSVPMLFISHSVEEMRLMTEQVLVVQAGRVKEELHSEKLARAGAASGERGYTNLLDLHAPVDCGDLVSYQWGGVQLMLVKGKQNLAGRFSLSSRDIMLFKRHPEAASARNMLTCRVNSIYSTEWLVGVELDCHGNTLIAEVVPQSVAELGIVEGGEVIAIFKASALRHLF